MSQMDRLNLVCFSFGRLENYKEEWDLMSKEENWGGNGAANL